MKKLDIIRAIAEGANITNAAASNCLDALTKTIENQLIKEGEFSLPGIGKMTVVSRAEREGRNPRTGQAATIQASKGLKFKVSSVLKDAIQ